jgi:hypothetical protein
MNDDFKNWLVEKEALISPVDLHVLVLSTGFWPFTAPMEFTLPKEVTL